MKSATCRQCGTPYPEHADSPDEVICAGCGARRAHPDAGLRPAAFRWEAMRHYSSRRTMFLEHRGRTDALALLLIAGAAAGALYATSVAPAFDWQGAVGLISRVPAIIGTAAGS